MEQSAFRIEFVASNATDTPHTKEDFKALSDFLHNEFRDKMETMGFLIPSLVCIELDKDDKFKRAIVPGY